MFLDNLSSHHSIYFTTNAEFHNIWLIFNAPYTPRLNPAEIPIKEIRRYLSPHFLENTDKIKEKVLEGFDEFIKYTKCADKWIFEHWTSIN
jgi:transposase